jgi:2-polyprenyl-3-methyl-5-hydroxy-6-metoxy-1,4-benzoquinol methylase
LRRENWIKYLKVTLQENKLEVHEPNVEILYVFTEYLPSDRYHHVLDIGAGAGIDMKVLMDKGYEVTGIGFGDENIRYAREELGIEIIQMDMHALKFKDETFDGILSIQTFEHALSPFIVASEISRVLKFGGRALIDTPDPDDEAMWSLHHPALLYPKQLRRLFSLVDLQVITDLSREHRTQIIFEKYLDV